MFNKSDLIKLNNYLWEIPKSFRRDMLVPARIYITEKMLDEVMKDKSLSQLVNLTTLPGIVKYSLAMPDIHEGYGAPIGGVFATKLPDGIISPGSVGYDINCLSPESKILLKNGAYLSIKEMESSWGSEEVKTIDLRKKAVIDSPLIHFFQRYNNPTIYRIITDSGEKIKATGEHPIQTENGMKETRFLNKDDFVLTYPFKGIHYQHPSSKIILAEKRFKEYLKKFNKTNKGNASSQILNQIRSRHLLPLTYNSSSLPSILKLMGYIFGDGVISFVNNKKGVVQFYGNPEDLKEIQKDIFKIGFKPPKIYSRQRNHSITTFYRNYKFSRTEYSIKIGSSAFAILLVALGTPYSLKTHQKYRIPNWIFNCPLWQKRLFLASFFGAELSSPSTLNKYNFCALQLNMQKAEKFKNNAKLFLKDIGKLLKEFGVQTYSIKEVPGYQYKGKYGKTVGLRLQIKGESKNLIKFFSVINYEYNQSKHKKACLAANYLKKKLKIVEMRDRARREIRKLYRKRGDFKKLAPQIIKKYVSEYISFQFLYHSLFKENSHGIIRKRGIPRVAFNFLSFNEYKEKYAYGDKGLVWGIIEKIEKIPYQNFVYDFTVNHPDHNFIADNFVVSNCGVRLLKSKHTEKEIRPYLEKLIEEIFHAVPSGLGKGGKFKFNIAEMDRILGKGIEYLKEKEYATEKDIEHCESGGCLKADPCFVSDLAKKRGRDQVGTLGSGNHFVEVQEVTEVYEEKLAEELGLRKGQVVVLIHTGSRGLGHQVATDYIRLFMQSMNKYNISLPDRELAAIPFSTPEGKEYFLAMGAAANFAWSNRQMITYLIRNAWKKVLGLKEESMDLVYDVAHNIAKIEEHEVDGEMIKLIVHRKGATRAFPDQPVLIPGTMGTASYILMGTEKSKEAFYTVCHGAGRTMSRHEAKRETSSREVLQQLAKKGIIVKSGSLSDLAEEAPLAYKDVDEVVEVVHQAGLAKKIVQLKPLAVIKG